MKIKLITSYKPGTWDTFAKRGIDSMVANLPHEIDIFLYCEEAKPKNVDKKIQCIDLNTSEPALINFKNNRLKQNPQLHFLDLFQTYVHMEQGIFCYYKLAQNYLLRF